MKLVNKRIYKGDSYTIGHLYVNNEYFCDILEDRVRDLSKESKVYGETAIPYGTYKITLDVVSPKFSKYPFYKEVCGGKLPRLLNVPYFEGILMHVADGYKGAELVKGCLGVGKNTIKGGLTDGKNTFKKLYKILKEVNGKEEITIDII